MGDRAEGVIVEINSGDRVPVCMCQLCSGTGKRGTLTCWLCRGDKVIPVVIHLRWVHDGRRTEEDPW